MTPALGLINPLKWLTDSGSPYTTGNSQAEGALGNVREVGRATMSSLGATLPSHHVHISPSSQVWTLWVLWRLHYIGMIG